MNSHNDRYDIYDILYILILLYLATYFTSLPLYTYTTIPCYIFHLCTRQATQHIVSDTSGVFLLTYYHSTSRSFIYRIYCSLHFIYIITYAIYKKISTFDSHLASTLPRFTTISQENASAILDEDPARGG